MESYRDKSRTASKMKPWQGYAHAGVVALSVWFFRETIFESLQWFNGRPPSDGLLLGCCIFMAGLACIPIVAFHFSHVLVFMSSFLIVFSVNFVVCQLELFYFKCLNNDSI